jgi:hypothetical protein
MYKYERSVMTATIDLPPSLDFLIMSTIQEDPARIQGYLRRLKAQESSPNPYVLHFDGEVGDLRQWLW